MLLTCFSWVFVQPGTGRRPVDCFRNEMPVLYARMSLCVGGTCTTDVYICIYIFIISFTLILTADWSIAVGYWTVFHCFSLLVNFRMGISVLSSLLKSRLNVLSSFAMVTMVDLKFIGHSLVVFYITRHTKRIKNKIKKLKLKKKKN